MKLKFVTEDKLIRYQIKDDKRLFFIIRSKRKTPGQIFPSKVFV